MFIKNKQHNTKKSAYGMQIKHDLVVGCVFSWWKYIPVILIFLGICVRLNVSVNYLIKIGKLSDIKISLADYIIYTFKGIERYYGNTVISSFWLIYNLYLAYIVGNYPLHNLYGNGQQILVRSKKRVQWWIGKVIWNVVNVLIFYVVGYLVIITVTLITGSLSLTPSISFQAIYTLYTHIDVSGWSTAWIWVIIFQPILSSLALCLIQLTISFFVKPIFSYIATMLIMVLSAHYCTPWLIGNYSMILRSDLILDGGVPFSFALIFSLTLSLAAVIIGGLRFNKMDILKNS